MDTSACNQPQAKWKYCNALYSISAGSKTDDKELCKSGFEKDGICYDTNILGNTEFKSCNSNIDCKYELLNSSGKGLFKSGKWTKVL